MSLSGRIRASLATAFITGAGALFAAGCGLLGTASPAAASSSQRTIFEAPTQLEQNPSGVLQILRSLGVDIVRVPVIWNTVAANPNSRTRPGNPYPAANWALYDKITQAAQSKGIAVDLMPTGPAPLWATATGAPRCNNPGGVGRICYDGDYKPSASLYGQFVKAVGNRYHSAHFWEVWNEANWGPSLSPQYQHSSVPVSAKVYRGLLDAGYKALRSSGHRGDTITFGSLSQDGSAHVGATGTSAPLIFLRTLYCLNNSYHQLTGHPAHQVGCPTSKAAFRHFRRAHPALFSVSGLGLHPYPFAGKPPTQKDFPNPNGAEFAEIPQVLRALDRLQKAYGSHKRMSIYNTEYAYRTRPPDTQSFFTDPTTAATYINEAEYLSWKNRRIATFDQYELTDAGWFPTGLFFGNGTPKPSFQSFRMPIWMPRTSASRGSALEVWGDARPAHFARSQPVQIQFAPAGSSTYTTIKTVGTNAYGYFDVKVNFPSSGSVRLAWSYPLGDLSLSDPLDPSQEIFSRVTNIQLH